MVNCHQDGEKQTEDTYNDVAVAVGVVGEVHASHTPFPIDSDEGVAFVEFGIFQRKERHHMEEYNHKEIEADVCPNDGVT